MSAYIDNDVDLQVLAEQLKQYDWIVLDTEFIRERNYYPQLCLIQIAAGDDILACIDPLTINDLSPLTDILADESITKVFHAAYQDLEIFYYLMDDVPRPIFDTQPAASVLGIGEQMGYARLVENLLGVQLEKSQSRTDWSRRPLSHKQIDYAIDDVRYLKQIYPIMLSKLENKQRLHWLEADFTMLASKSTYEIDGNESWKRVKGKQVLKGVQLAILQKLSAWREAIAMLRDKPRRWIISDDILVDMARTQPDDESKFQTIRGVGEKHFKRYYKTWIALIEEGKQVPEEEWPKQAFHKKPSPTQDILVDLLMTVVKYQAKQNKVSASVIATRKQVANMVIEGRRHLSHDWRGMLVNDQFEAVLSGEASLSVEDGRVVFIESNVQEI